jgi:hypothetical protein
MSRLKIALLAVFALFFIATPSFVHAQNLDACEGVQWTGAEVDCKDGNLSDKKFGNVVRSIINLLSVLVGAVSVIMIIIGGFRYVVSNGDSNGVSGAKNTILYAIVGLVIVLFAQVIVRFVLSKV